MATRYQLIPVTPRTSAKAITAAVVVFAFICGLVIGGYAVYSNLNTGTTSENLHDVKDLNIKSDHLQGNSNLSRKNLYNKTKPTIEPTTVASTVGLTISTTPSSIKKAPKGNLEGNEGKDSSYIKSDQSKGVHNLLQMQAYNEIKTAINPKTITTTSAMLTPSATASTITKSLKASKSCSTDADCAQTRACKDQQCTRATCVSECEVNQICIARNHTGTCLPLCKVTCSDNSRKRRSPVSDLDSIVIKETSTCQLKLFARNDLTDPGGYRCTVETEEETCFIRKRQISQFAKVKNGWIRKGNEAIKSIEVLGDCSWDITGTTPGDVSRLGGNNKKMYKGYNSFNLTSPRLFSMQKVPPTKQT